MSVDLIRDGSLEPPQHTELTTTNATTVHTASSAYNRIIESISLANVDAANACIVTLAWVDATPTSHTFWHGEVAAKSTTIVKDLPLVTSGTGVVRSITAQAAAANDIHVNVFSSLLAKARSVGL